MTLASETASLQFSGNGSTTAFPITFNFWDDDDLRVILTVTATAVETVWTKGTQYTVTGGNGSTGTVTATTAPATGETLTVISNITNTQDTDLPAGGAFPSTSVEQQMDKIVRQVQQLDVRVTRALKLAESSTVTDPSMPAPASGKLIRWKSTLDGFENVTLAELATGGTVATPISVADGGTGSTTAAAARTALDVPSLAGNNTHTGTQTWQGINSATKIQKWAKGADVASANALTLGDDGNYFDITGTTAVTSIATKGAGTWVKLQFDAALALTHHATDLILPGAANITTAAGDEAEFVEYATGDWRCTSYVKASGRAVIGGLVLQCLQTAKTDSFTTTSTTATDITGLSQAITPKSTSNKILVIAAIAGTGSTSFARLQLVRDTTAIGIGDAAGSRERAGGSFGVSSGDQADHTTLVWLDSPASVAALTYKVQGWINVGTLYINRSVTDTDNATYARLVSTITVMEISA